MSSGQPVLPVPQQALHGYDEVPATVMSSVVCQFDVATKATKVTKP